MNDFAATFSAIRRGLLMAVPAALVALPLAPLHAAERADETCRTYWVDGVGNGWEEILQSNETWPLLHFVKNAPSWTAVFLSPSACSGFGCALVDPVVRPPDDQRLQWWSLEGLAPLQKIGEVAGRALYDMAYGPAHRAVLWEANDSWEFCPIFLYNGGSVIAGIDRSTLFTWQGKELLSIRVHVAGNGALQLSYFFAFPNDKPQPLSFGGDDVVGPYVEANNLEIYHRGGGFCEGKLVSRSVAWKRDCHESRDLPLEERPELCRVDDTQYLRVEYELRGLQLAATNVALMPWNASGECDQHPEQDR